MFSRTSIANTRYLIAALIVHAGCLPVLWTPWALRHRTHHHASSNARNSNSRHRSISHDNVLRQGRAHSRGLTLKAGDKQRLRTLTDTTHRLPRAIIPTMLHPHDRRQPQAAPI